MLGWVSGATLLLGVLTAADLSPMNRHTSTPWWSCLFFILATGFSELVHLVTRDKLLGRNRNSAE